MAVPVERVNSSTGTLVSSSTDQPISRLSKLALAIRYQKLVRSHPNMPSIENLNANLSGEFEVFMPFYRGLKLRSQRYRKVKYALKDTLKESNLGSWNIALLACDMFNIRDLGK